MSQGLAIGASGFNTGVCSVSIGISEKTIRPNLKIFAPISKIRFCATFSKLMGNILCSLCGFQGEILRNDPSDEII